MKINGTDIQDPLVSGTNIKTINGTSVLGEGNLVVGGGGNTTPPTHVFIEPKTGRYFDNRTNTTTNNAICQAFALNLSAFTPAYDLTINEIRLSVSTALTGGLIKFLIYSDDEGFPKNLLFTSAEVSSDTIGIKTVTNISFTFQKNTRYWLSLILNNNINLRVIVNTSGINVPIISSGVGNINQLNTNYFISLAASGYNTPPTVLNLSSGDIATSNIPLISFRSI